MARVEASCRGTYLKNELGEKRLVLVLVLGDAVELFACSVKERLEVLLARLEDLQTRLVGLVRLGAVGKQDKDVENANICVERPKGANLHLLRHHRTDTDHDKRQRPLVANHIRNNL